MKKILGLLMLLVMAGAFMTLSMEQSHGEPVAAISHEIEVAGSGSICELERWDVVEKPDRTVCTNGGSEACPGC